MTDPLTRVPGIWRAGMLAGCGTRGLVRITDPALFAENYLVPNGHGWTAPTILLDDPTGATTGCLAAFCRGLWKLPDLYCRPLLPGGWVVGRPFTRPDIVFDDVHGPTEAAAWRNAILAHPSLTELR